MRASNIFAGIIVLVFCLTATLAETHVGSNVQCTGECTVTQNHNGESVQVTSDRNLIVNTTANDQNVNITIQSDGVGTVALNLSKNDSAFTISADNSPAEENDTGISCNDSEICSPDNNLADNSGQEYYSESSPNKTIETTSDGVTETTQTEGFFQQVYHFFQGFTARIFW